MLSISPVPVSIPWSQFQDFIITSAQVFECLKDLPHHGRYWCVGAASAQRAREYGLSNLIIGPGTAEGLVEHIRLNPPSSSLPFLYLRGQDISLPITEILRQNHILAQEVIVYASHERPHISPELTDHFLDHKISLIPFFSKKTSETFVKLIEKAHLTKTMTSVTALALSQKIAKTLEILPFQHIYINDPLENNIIEEYYKLTLDRYGDKL